MNQRPDSIQIILINTLTNVLTNRIIKTFKVMGFVALIVLVLIPSYSFALGLGGIKLKSTLDQKLDAKIELLGITNNDLKDMQVQLASPAVYERMGIDRNIELEQLKFSIIELDNGKHNIHVTTRLRVTEPFLNFLIEVNWASGRLLREFTVLLDPPVLLDEESAAPVNTPTTGLAPELDSPLNLPVEGQMLFTQSDESVLETPGQFEEQINEEAEEFSEAGSSTQSSIVESVSSIEPEPTAEPVVKPSGSLVYNKVKNNEILWNIADQMRPENITVEQMMLALQRENPGAFFGDNVSMLNAGAVLRIDDVGSLSNVTQDKAILEIQRQHQDWLAYRRERQAQNAVAVNSADLVPLGSESSSVASGDMITSSNSEPLLRLVSPLDEKDKKNNSAQSNAALEAAERKVNELNIELVMATEELEARKHENEDLLNRLSSLDEQMSAMQSLIQLKDAELAKITGQDVGESDVMSLSVDISNNSVENNSTQVKSIPTEKLKDTFKHVPLWQDPITLATIAFSSLLIALMFWILTKRRRLNKAVAELNEENLDRLFPEDEAIATNGNEAAATNKTIIKLKKDSNQPDFSNAFSNIDPLTEISFEDTDFVESSENLLDPLSEADVYLTYEKYGKAQELLHSAIAKEPGRQELKLKLLEVFCVSKNLEAFDNQAEEIFAAIAGDEADLIWEQATEMARIVNSTSPLFAAIDSPPLHGSENENAINADLSSDSQDSRQSSSNTQWLPDLVTEFSAIDQDISKSSMADSDEESKDQFDSTILDDINVVDLRENIIPLDTAFKKPDNQPLENAKVVTNANNNTNIKATDSAEIDETITEINENIPSNLKITSIGRSSGEIETEQAETSIKQVNNLSDNDLSLAMEAFTEASIAEHLDKEDKFISKLTMSDVFDDIPDAIEENSMPEVDSATIDTSLFLLSDEVGTKLDLARAYIEMGDHEGATDLLEEVIGEGNQTQKLEAKHLLEIA